MVRYRYPPNSIDDVVTLIDARRTSVLLYQEPSLDFAIPTHADEYKSAPKDRAKWDAASFAEKHGLKLVAVNYVVVRGDD